MGDRLAVASLETPFGTGRYTEIGLDILNPIQPASMDPAHLKRAFGDKLCFWGSIDEQHSIGKGGGLIIGPTHHVQLDTPLENFWAMVHAITETRY